MDALDGAPWREEDEMKPLPTIPTDEEVKAKAIEAFNKMYSPAKLSRLVEEKLMAEEYDVKVPSKVSQPASDCSNFYGWMWTDVLLCP